MARVFVSHAGADTACAKQLYQWLKEDGHEAFLDQERDDGILPGEDWEKRLYKELRKADAVVCIVTESYLKSVWCAAEIGAARALGAELLPVQFSSTDELHTLLKPLQGLNAARDPVEARERLRLRLSVIDGGGGWGWPDERSPYAGLRLFDLDEHRVFFGRAREITQIAERLRSPERAVPAILTVVGPSGCGKSSLIRAGVLPRIAGEHYWLPLAPIVPGTDPLGSLVRAMASVIRARHIPFDATSLRKDLNRDGLKAVCTDLLLAANADSQCKLLIVVDQFEELLTQTAPPERAEFATTLQPALGGPVQVLATLRPEFLDPIAKDSDLSKLPRRIREVRPLEADALRSIIEEPARLAGLRVEEDLVTRLVSDTGSGDALPLLAFTLQQLADGLIRGDALTNRRYAEIGGVQGALQRQADAALKEACDTTGVTRDQVISSQLSLVTIDEQGRPTKRHVVLDELSDLVSAQLQPFINRRLLSTEASGERTTVAVSHEAFLVHWPPLKDEIDTQATALRARRVVENAASDWVAGGRDVSALLQGRQLSKAMVDTGAEMEPVAETNACVSGERKRLVKLPKWGRRRRLVTRVDLNGTGREFLDASIRADRSRRRRQMMQVASVMAILALISVIAVVFAVKATRAEQQAQDEAQQATASRLESEAAAMLSQDKPGGDVQAMQQLLAANALAPDTAAGGLLDAVLRRLTTAKIADARAGVFNVAVSPDGRSMASVGDDNRVRLWNTDTGQPLGPAIEPSADERLLRLVFSTTELRVASRSADNTVRVYAETGDLISTLHTTAMEPVASVAFSPDGHRLATFGDGRTVRVWNADTGVPVSVLHMGDMKPVGSVAFNSDGHRLATGGTDGIVRMWNADTGDPLGAALSGHVGSVRAVVFSRDGHRLATGGADKTLRLWNTDDGLPQAVFTGHTNRVGSVAFSPDGRRLASGGTDNTVRVWNLDNGQPEGAPLTGHTDWVQSVAFRDDDRLATGSADGTVRLWNLGQPLMIGQDLDGVVLSSNGDRVFAVGHDQTVRVWNVRTRQAIQLTGGTDNISAAAFSPDGHRLATGDAKGRVQVWNADTGQPEGSALIGHTERMRSLAFSPDVHRLATAGDDRTARVWDADNGRFLRTLQWADMEPARSVAFSPDGHRLATGSADGTVALWNADTGDPLGIYPSAHSGIVRAMVFSGPDGNRLVTAGDDQTVRLWTADASPTLANNWAPC